MTRTLVETKKILLNYLAQLIQESINKFLPGWGFTLLIFEFNKKSIGSYISSAERETMTKSLKEMVKVLEEDKVFPVDAPGPLH